MHGANRSDEGVWLLAVNCTVFGALDGKEGNAFYVFMPMFAHIWMLLLSNYKQM